MTAAGAAGARIRLASGGYSSQRVGTRGTIQGHLPFNAHHARVHGCLNSIQGDTSEGSPVGFTHPTNRPPQARLAGAVPWLHVHTFPATTAKAPPRTPPSMSREGRRPPSARPAASAQAAPRPWGRQPHRQQQRPAPHATPPRTQPAALQQASAERLPVHVRDHAHDQ